MKDSVRRIAEVVAGVLIAAVLVRVGWPVIESLVMVARAGQ